MNTPYCYIEDEILAVEYFRGWGFEISKVPEVNSGRRCDFIISDESDSYLMEAKKVEESAEPLVVADLEGDFELHTKTMAYSAKMTQKVHDAMKQLDNTAKEFEAEYKLIWFNITNRFTDIGDYDRLLSTIYGLRRISCLDESKSRISKGCYYFSRCAFTDYKDLDAVVVAQNNGFVLWVNNYASKYEKFLQTGLFKSFHSFIRDPSTSLEDKYIIANCDVDRSNKAEVVKYLFEKYGYTSIIETPLDEHYLNF